MARASELAEPSPKFSIGQGNARARDNVFRCMLSIEYRANSVFEKKIQRTGATAPLFPERPQRSWITEERILGKNSPAILEVEAPSQAWEDSNNLA
ncbi:hypothetical protein KM043_010502 [Ampulex compressa]|nr:hypothetical protein KM043_010502 [Ampulex compressa]